LWAVRTFFYDKEESTDTTVTDINRIAKEKGFVVQGDYIINLASMPINEKGMVNTMRVSEIE
jgi:pyruvate kinase